MNRPRLPLLLLALLLAACESRVSVYSPRRTDRDVHRKALTNTECTGCHRAQEIPSHQQDDNCLRCHKLCRGC